MILKQPISLESLVVARSYLNIGDLAGLYKHFSDMGYLYPGLALGVVKENTLSGIAAIGYMQAVYKKTNGAYLDISKLSAIKQGMANGYLTAIKDIVRKQNTLNSDLNADATLTFHSNTFQSLGLSKDSWTLYIPFEILGPGTARDTLWNSILVSQSLPSRAGYDVNGTLTASMAMCSLACQDTYKKARAGEWLDYLLKGADAQIELHFTPPSPDFIQPIALNTIIENSVKIGPDVDIKAMATRLAEAETGPLAPDNAQQHDQAVAAWAGKLASLRVAGTSGIHALLTQRDTSGAVDSLTRDYLPSGDLQQKLERLTQTNGLYDESTTDGLGRATKHAFNWHIDNWAGRAVNVDAVNDLLQGTYHHMVSRLGDPAGKVIWEANSWYDPAGHVVRREQDNEAGSYHDWVHQTRDEISPTIWEAWTWHDGLGRFVRHDLDSQTGQYHDVVHLTAAESSPAIWEALTWYDPLSRVVRREIDTTTQNYHDYVHDGHLESAPVVWEAWTWRTGDGKVVRHDQFAPSGRYHDVVHANGSESSPVIWEAWNLRDAKQHDVRHEKDNLSGRYHDYVHVDPTPYSTVIAEAWDDVAADGKYVRHEIDKPSATYHDYTYVSSATGAALSNEKWTERSDKGINSFDKTYNTDKSAHLDYSLATGETGWANGVNGTVNSWDKTAPMAVVGRVGVRPNPLYMPLSVGNKEPSTLDVDGLINGAMHMWYHDTNNRGWSFSSNYGTRFSYFDKGSFYNEAMFANPFATGASAPLKASALDAFGSVGPDGFNSDLFSEPRLVGIVTGDTITA